MNDTISLRWTVLTLACSSLVASSLFGCSQSSTNEELGRTAYQLLNAGRDLRGRNTQALDAEDLGDGILDGVLDSIPSDDDLPVDSEEISDGATEDATEGAPEDVLDSVTNGTANIDPNDIVGGVGGVSEETYSIAGQAGEATVRSVSGLRDSAIAAAYSIDFEQYSNDGEHIIHGVLDYVALAPSGEDLEAEVFKLVGEVDLQGFSVERFEAELEMTVKKTKDSVQLILTGVISADGEDFHLQEALVDLEDLKGLGI